MSPGAAPAGERPAAAPTTVAARAAGATRAAADPGVRASEVLLAIDVGTSGARASVFDLEGHRLLEVRRGYPTAAPREGWAEQDARLWRSCSLAAVRGAVASLPPGTRVRAIGLTGQCPSIVGVDARGEPTGPGLIYRDNRAVAEADAIRERYGDAAYHARTGHLPAAFHVGPKVLWLRQHRPREFAATVRFLQPRDLVVRALTGIEATDGTHAAATLFMDIRTRAWADDLLADHGLHSSIFPELRGSWEVVGEVLPAVARRLGLPPGVPVVLGGADSQACALGAGVVAPGPVSEMAGSSTCLNAAVQAPLPEILVTHYTHVVPGPYTTETGINTTGLAIDWVARLAYGGRTGRPRRADWAALDREVAAVEPGSAGVLAVPVLGDGERTDPSLRGALTGLSLRHGRAEIARAMLEGVACEIREQLDLLRAGGAAVTELRVSGGDTRLGSWNRIKADVTGLPVIAIPDDAAVTGVAMLAGIGAGIYRDADEAIARCVHADPPVAPDPRAHARYAEVYAGYRTLVESAEVRR
jgi:xylulokinase